MRVKIYLRAIKRDGEDYLALFDSNRNGDINNLETVVEGGSTVIWQLDCCSGIKNITRIFSGEKEHPIFKSNPVKRFLCKGFKLQIEKGAKGREKYAIECTLNNDRELNIDPFIRVRTLI
jgi:hypothetical protein